MKALVLGGTHGLGAEIARILQEQGGDVVVAGRRNRGAAHGRHLPVDLAAPASTEDFRQRLEAEDQERPFTHFFWLAAYLKRQEFAQLAPEELTRMIDVNLRQPLLIAHWFWQRMQRQNREGAQRFAVVASTVGLSDQPRDDEAIYAATKAAQVSFARALGKNHQQAGLHVSLHCPGGMQTGLWEGNENPLYSQFMEPAKVARLILDKVEGQTTAFLEVVIPRGSV